METLDKTQNFLAIEDDYSNYNNSKIVILPIPYENGVSYRKGTSDGPAALLEASAYVEFYDDEFERELCFDIGIATLEPFMPDFPDGKELARSSQELVDALIRDKKFVVTIGGEHTVSIGPVLAHYKNFPDMSILHFDAHSDLRESYDDSPYSHACFMARVMDVFPPSRVTQVGIRAQCIEEAQFIKENNVKTFYASAIRRGLHGQDWQKKIVDTLSQQIYVSFDVDYFDPAIMPSTGTPEPDGFLYSETLDIFREIVKSGKQIIGLDVVELAPIKDLHHSDLTAARLLYKILNFAFRL